MDDVVFMLNDHDTHAKHVLADMEEKGILEEDTDRMEFRVGRTVIVPVARKRGGLYGMEWAVE